MPIAIALWLGMLVCGLAPWHAAWWIGAAVPCAVAGIVRRSRVADLSLALAIALSGAARHTAHVAVLEAQRPFIAAGDLHRVRGTITGHPARETDAPVAPIEVDEASPALPRGARLRVRLPEGCMAEWGDGVEALVRVEAPGFVRNPGGVDPRAIADASGTTAQGQALSVVVERPEGHSPWPRATVVHWRRSIEKSLAAGLTPGAHELIAPLVTGDRTAMSSELDASLRAAGIVHVIALSGLHVSGLAAVMRVLASMLGGGLRVRAAAGALCAVLYLGIAGPLPSLARAAATESLATLARFLGRAVDPLQALAVSALLLLTVAPGWSHDLGFQLSCVATAGLMAGLHAVRGAVKGRQLLQGVAGSIGAQIAAAPLLLLRLHGIAWVAPFTNLAAVPLASLLLAAAWLAALWDLALPGSGRVWFAACEALAVALRATSDAGARLPHALVSTGSSVGLPMAAGVGAVLVLAAALHGRTLDDRRRDAPLGVVAARWIGAAVLVATMISAATTPALRPPPGSTWVVVLDVGQGDAIAIGSAAGWCLVDAGPAYPHGDAGASRVLPFLRWAVVRRLNGVVLTHGDRDHAGGMASVLREVRTLNAWTPVPVEGTQALGVATGRLAVDWRAAVSGDTLRPCACAVVLWPPAGDSLREEPRRNPRSLVLRLGDDRSAALLLADVDAAAESRLQVVRAELIKVAHHGSRSSTSAEFLARARPAHAAISCGARNRYGHPDAGVLARLAAAGARIARTDREGAVWYVLDPNGVRRLDWRRREHEASTATPAAPSASRPWP